MRTRTIVLALAILVLGAMGGAILAPPPADAVSREIIQIQQSIAQILQNQQDMRNDIASRFASMQTLVQQSLTSANQLNQNLGSLQKTIQDAQANNGASSTSTTQQMQGISDNMQDMQARMGKLAQQITDIQSTLQQINAKVSGGAPATQAPGTTGSNPYNPGSDGSATQQPVTSPQPAAPPQGISGDTLYSNALRDLNSAHYDLSRQEFNDYLKNFPDGAFAPNAQFYLGELFYAQAQYSRAIAAYDGVILNYPKSSKVAPAMLEKGRALAQTNKKASAMREFRELIRKYSGSDEAKKAASELRGLSPSH
ncbi:MAG TPA: tol-pal system protein YbgF [Candidatus Acidoferrales bacterium]|nr:tol-pal system protein YbgF [Candidatus Acidoferrales bacterium]